MSSLVSWLLAAKGIVTKGLRTFLDEARAGLIIFVWSIVFAQDQRSTLASEGKKMRQQALNY